MDTDLTPKPYVDRLAEHLKRSGKLFMDETTAPVLDPARGVTKTGYLWALDRDDPPKHKRLIFSTRGGVALGKAMGDLPVYGAFLPAQRARASQGLQPVTKADQGNPMAVLTAQVGPKGGKFGGRATAAANNYKRLGARQVA